MDIQHARDFRVVLPTNITNYTKTKLYGINKFNGYQNQLGFRDFMYRGELNPQESLSETASS